MALQFLQRWIGRLNSMPSAPKKGKKDWRNRRYAYIKLNAREQGLDAWLLAYLQKNFATASLTTLSDEQLDKTYRAVAAKKRR